MEQKYRLKQEELLNNHILNQEILVHCIAKLNTKVDTAYKKCRIIKASYQNNLKIGCSNAVLQDKQDYEAWKYKYNCLIAKRKPLLDTLMQGCHLSLEDAKGLIKQVVRDKFPTYKTVDEVIQMIRNNDFKLK